MNGQILHEAHELINGPRQTSYGKPDENFKRIAVMWSAYLDTDISAADVACMMVLLKMARQAHALKLDNLIDAAGYIGLAADLAGNGGDNANRN